ncbi:MAG: DUF3808 domain-containing protein, partial [Bacteroidetes bacterium]
HLRLGQAGQSIDQLSDPALRHFYSAHIPIYKFMATQSPVYLHELQENWGLTIDAIEDLPDENKLKNVMLAELYYKRAALEFLDGNYFTALRFLQSSRSSIRRNEKKFPGNENHLKVLGIFNVALGAVPRKYQWLTNILGFSGDMDLGMDQLRRAAKTGHILPLEADLFAYYVEKNMLDQPHKAIDRLTQLKKRYPTNLIVDLCLAAGYMSIKENEAALQLLRARNQYRLDQAVFFSPLWDYQLGKAFYFKEDYFRAQIYFEQFLKQKGSKLFRTDATFRLGMSLTLNGSYQEGLRFFRLLASDKSSGFDDDAYAENMARRFARHEPSAHVKALFRARNLFDGGYYQQALAILDGLASQALNVADRTELAYRYARIYHSQGALQRARQQYLLCIAQPQSEQLWLQVYAHYFLGEIAREAGDFSTARSYYKSALEFDDYFYQDGLENRCKIALSALKRQ